jgi:hypothetical protein
MADFIKAIKEGLNYKPDNGKEIMEVFDDLNRQIYNEYGNEFNVGLNCHSIFIGPPTNKGWGSVINLAKYQRGRDYGYPFTMYLNGINTVCNDKEQLEQCLQKLFSQPFVGDIIRKILNREVFYYIDE